MPLHAAHGRGHLAREDYGRLVEMTQSVGRMLLTQSVGRMLRVLEQRLKEPRPRDT